MSDTTMTPPVALRYLDEFVAYATSPKLETDALFHRRDAVLTAIGPIREALEATIKATTARDVVRAEVETLQHRAQRHQHEIEAANARKAELQAEIDKAVLRLDTLRALAAKEEDRLNSIRRDIEAIKAKFREEAAR